MGSRQWERAVALVRHPAFGIRHLLSGIGNPPLSDYKTLIDNVTINMIYNYHSEYIRMTTAQLRRNRLHIHIVCGKHNVESLARAMSCSTATVARTVEGLREELKARGMELASLRTEDGAYYIILNHEQEVRRRWARSKLRSLAGVGTKWRPFPGKSEDEIIYGDA